MTTNGELTAVARQIEARQPGAIRTFFEKTGKVLASNDIHSAAASKGLEELVESLLLPDTLDGEALRDDDAIAIIEEIRSGNMARAKEDEAVRHLTSALAQPNLSDLIYWPRDGKKLETRALLEIARTKRGEAIRPFLDRMCKINPQPGMSPEAKTLSTIRRVLVDMAEAGELELSRGEDAVMWLASVLPDLATGDQLCDRLCEADSGVADVFAEDETLNARLVELKRGLPPAPKPYIRRS